MYKRQVRNAKNITSYIGIPKRAFTSPGEVDAFLWLLENSCPSEENIDRRPILDRGGDMVFTFNVTEEMWAHIYGEAVQILTDKSLLGRKRIPTGLVEMCIRDRLCICSVWCPTAACTATTPISMAC